MPINKQASKNNLTLPAGVNLRECSVVIIGSTCRICGRDFKCITDVALHMQWRHQPKSALNGDFNAELNRDDNPENFESPKCDVCNEHTNTASDLKSYKRQISKKQMQDKRRARKLRLIIKIAGVTMTEIRLSRKYLKVRNSDYLDVGTQTESHENEKRQDDYGTSIDLSLADRVVGNSRTQCVQSHKATNRYIEGKLASIQGDAIACSTGAPERSPFEILNTPNRDPTLDSSDGLCASHVYHCEIASSQTHTATMYAESIADTMAVHDESNSPRRSEREGKNVNPAAEDTLLLEDRVHHCQNNSPRDRPRESVICCQQVQPTEETSVAKPNTGTHRSRRHPVWSNKATRSRAINELADSSMEPIEIIIDNESDDNCDEYMKKCSTASSTQTVREKQSLRVTPAVDDEVQEILRITRGNVQDDINHESPNRTEREMLVRNALGQMYISSTQPEVIYTDKDNAILVMKDNIDLRDCSPCMAIDNAYQFPNVATFTCKTHDKTLDAYLNDLRHYGIEYYNPPEINNNG